MKTPKKPKTTLPTIDQVRTLVKERYQYADTIRDIHVTTVYYAVIDLIQKEGVENAKVV